MTLTRRRSLQLVGAAIAAPFVSCAALAQSWPTRTIRAIVPVGAGSTIDIVSRIVFDRLSQQLGQPIVSENRAGAGGTLGGAIVARAEPDGHTLLINSSQHSASPAVYPNLSYDTAR